MSIADDALRSIIRQARATPKESFDIYHFRGQVRTMLNNFDADEELGKEAYAVLEELERKYLGIDSGERGAVQ